MYLPWLFLMRFLFAEIYTDVFGNKYGRMTKYILPRVGIYLDVFSKKKVCS